MTWTKSDIPSQAGKRVVVTGANSGIGWRASLELARAGAEVTLASRSLAKADDAALRIRQQVPAANLRTRLLNWPIRNPLKCSPRRSFRIPVLWIS